MRTLRLDELHDDLLQHVLRELDDPKDLAALSSQCRRLRQRVHASPVWQCQCRWTSYGIPWDLVDGRGWAEVYRQLDVLPDVVMVCVGDFCQLSSDWGELELEDHDLDSALDAFAVAMEAVYHLGMFAAVEDAEVLDGYAAALLRRDLHTWLSLAPHVVCMFGEDLIELMEVWPCHHVDCQHEVMDELAWRRSAVEFLPQVVARGTDPSRLQYAHVLRGLAHQAATFDAWLRELMLLGSDGYHHGVGKPTPPPGVWWKTIDALPESHWWWRMPPAPGHRSDSGSYGDGDDDSA